MFSIDNLNFRNLYSTTTEVRFNCITEIIFYNTWLIFVNVMMISYSTEKTPDCSFDAVIYNNGTLPRCPTVVGTYVVPMLMGLYVLFSNILLLNLLIAMFR